MTKYFVIVSFSGAVEMSVEAKTEEEAIQKVEDGLANGSIEIADKDFATSAEIDGVYV